MVFFLKNIFHNDNQINISESEMVVNQIKKNHLCSGESSDFIENIS